MNPRHSRGIILALAYLTAIVFSNWLVNAVGIVPVGFGLMAPAAAYVIGLIMVLRDLTQDQLGPYWAYLAMLIGTGLSFIFSPQVAIAAAAAFLISETADQLVYTPLRRKSIIVAVLASNTVGIIADSFIFVWIAFGTTDFVAGQIWAKALSTVAVVILLKLIYRHRTTIRPAYLIAKDQKRTSEGIPA